MVKVIIYRSDGRAYVKCRDGSVTTWARVVARNELGRELIKSEEVHHIDGDWTNDAPANLEVLTRREHAKRHPDKMGWLATRWRSGTCLRCDCSFDEYTDGCAACFERHRARMKRARRAAA